MTTPLWPTDWLTKESNRNDSNRATDQASMHVLLDNWQIVEHLQEVGSAAKQSKDSRREHAHVGVPGSPSLNCLFTSLGKGINTGTNNSV